LEALAPSLARCHLSMLESLARKLLTLADAQAPMTAEFEREIW
jgi:hypothetical protein